MDIDQVIAEASAPVDAQPQPEANEAVDANVEVNEEAVETKPEAKQEEVWPKKAINTLSRKEKQIIKQKAIIEQLNSELSKFRQPQQQVKQENDRGGEPKEEDFQSYAEYMRALQKYDLQQEIAKFKGEQQKSQVSQQEQSWVAQREQAVANQAQAFIKENPELLDLLEEHGDLLDEWEETHPHLTRAFLEADDAPMAFFNLAKEGKLEALASMSPAKAAMEIGRAQTRATAQKPVTKAPAPLSTPKGTATGTKSVEHMSTEQLLKWAHKS